MSFPSGPEYASYRTYCRELRLEREFEEGDWYVWFDGGGDRPDWPRCISAQAARDGLRAGGAYVFLPRLDQLVAMLVAAGVPEVCTARVGDGWETEGGHRGSSPEEAPLRLWAAVTGRVVDA